MSTKLQVTLPEDLLARLKIESRRRRMSMAHIIREATTMWLEKHRGKPAGKSALAAFVDINPGETEEDVTDRIDEIVYEEP